VYLILYSKPGCHLCEGLQEKLEQIQSFQFALEVRDITTREDWFQAYQYEIPVLFAVQEPATQSPPISLPRISPRASVQQIERLLQRHLLENSQNKSE
jgi:glutaredoxin